MISYDPHTTQYHRQIEGKERVISPVTVFLREIPPCGKVLKTRRVTLQPLETQCSVLNQVLIHDAALAFA
jgi:hypothetical protein